MNKDIYSGRALQLIDNISSINNLTEFNISGRILDKDVAIQLINTMIADFRMYSLPIESDSDVQQ